jgi:enoyl-CoA hydratase
MTGLVNYRYDEPVAIITMDDGNVNALGPAMQQSLNDALDNAEADHAGAVVITGNNRVFSGGFDLKILTSGEVTPAIEMLKGGFELSHRLLSNPKPVVMACTGHAIAMGAVLLSSGDHRVAAPAYSIAANIAADEAANVAANEVLGDMPIPRAALAVMRLRLTPSAYQQAAVLAKAFFGENAVAAGWLDEIVLPDMVLSRALEAAQEFATLDQPAHAATKLRTRAEALAGIRAGIDQIDAEFGR